LAPLPYMAALGALLAAFLAALLVMSLGSLLPRSLANLWPPITEGRPPARHCRNGLPSDLR